MKYVLKKIINKNGIFRSDMLILISLVWEKRGACQLVHGDLQNGSTRYWNYLEDY